MESPDRRKRSASGESKSELLALCTLYAAIGFTPWAWGTGLPWAQFVFRVLGLLALCVVALGLRSGGPVRSAWMSRAAWSMVALLGVSLLSAALSIHRGKSLEAMLDLLAISGLFLVAVLYSRGARRLRGLALMQVIAAVPVAVIGLAQYFRPELLPASNSYPGRALGPFGQPNRLGGYLIAAIPVALALALATQDRLLRAVFLLAVAALTMCLVVTFSRGAWIGFAAALVVLAAGLLRWPALLPRGATLFAAAACVVVPALLFLPSILARLAPKPTESTAWNLAYDPEREGSGAMRREIWAGALAAAAARPVAGFGVGTFREAFDRMKGERMKRLEAEGTRTADHAHNEYLNLLVERGALGLAAFLAVALIGLAAAFAALQAGGGPAASRWLVLGFAGAVVALLAHATLDLNLVLAPHTTLLYADLGLLAASAPAPERASRRSAWRAAVGVVAAVAGLGAATMSYAASRDAGAAARALGGNQPGRAAALLTQACRLAPWNDTHAVSLAHAEEFLAARVSLPAPLRDAEAAYRHAIAVNGSDPVTRQELARLYLAHGDVFGDRGVVEARAELERALAQNPYYAEIRNDLGVALLQTGDRAGAERAFRLAAQGRRDFVDPLVNLAALALQSGDETAARGWIGQALERAPHSARALRMAASLDAAPNSHGRNGD